jgi:3-hydroxyacyl-CoA dehydrogenase
MLYADTVGLPNVLETMRRFGRGPHGDAWAPAARLERLAGAGKGFND